MSTVLYFLAAVAISVGVTALAVVALHRPMSNILAELCGSRERGDFWVVLASLCMLLAATAGSTFPDRALGHRFAAAPAPLLNAILQCASGLAGVLISLLVLTGALLLFIRQFEERLRLAPEGASRGAIAVGPRGRDALHPRSGGPLGGRIAPVTPARRSGAGVLLLLLLLVIALIRLMESIEQTARAPLATRVNDGGGRQ
jgi:hypothetical protein